MDEPTPRYWRDLLQSLQGKRVQVGWTTGMGMTKGVIWWSFEDYIVLRLDRGADMHVPHTAILNVEVVDA